MLRTCTLFILVVTIFFAPEALAQSYKWVKGGGSSITYQISGEYEQVLNMCTDSNGNVYTISNVGSLNILADTFYVNASHNSSIGVVHNLFASYRCDGTMRFAKMIEGWGNVTNGGIEYSNGSIYMTGDIYSSGTHYKHIGEDTTITSGNYRSFTAKFDTTGDLTWIRFIGPDQMSTVTQLLYPGALAVDGQGNIHNFSLVRPGCTIGTFTTTVPGTYDIKYDPAGNLLSVAQVPALDSTWMISKVVYSKQSNRWYATIQPQPDYYYYVHSDWNSAVCAFNSNETLLWMDTTGQSGGIAGIDYKGGKDLYVSGGGQTQVPFSLGGISVGNTLGYANAVIFKLDTNGVAHWAYNLMGSIGVTSLSFITICSPGKIAATGVFGGLAVHGTDSITSAAGEGQNVLFVIADSAGNTVKLDQLHGSGFYDEGTAITSDKIGNVYIGGQVQTEISATGLSPYIINGGNTDNFVMKYGVDCNCTATPIASFSHSGTGTVNFTYTGTTVGLDSLRWDFGDGGTSTVNNPSHTYTSSGNYTVCVTVYTSCGSDVTCVSLGWPSDVSSPGQAGMRIYPNPAKENLVIENAGIGSTVKMFNMPGQLVYQGKVAGERGIISVANLAVGSYVIMLKDKAGNVSRQVIVRE